MKTLLPLAALFLGALPLGQTSPDPFEARKELVVQAVKAYREKRPADAARLYEQAVAQGDRQVGTYYMLACCLARAEEKDRAFLALDRALERGFRETRRLETDPDLVSLRSDPRWRKLVERCRRAEEAFDRRARDPGKARLVTSDLPNFWAAYDEAMKRPRAEWEAIFTRLYFDRGDIGLEDYFRVRRITPKALATVVERQPKFFASIRWVERAIRREERPLQQSFRRLKQLYPGSRFPDMYFLMGRFSGGGTTSPNGLLMSAEFFTKARGTPTSELGDWSRRVLMPISDIVPLVTHEVIHYQQKTGPRNTLLAKCIGEGSADFLAEVVCGRLIERIRELHAWGNAREAMLWTEFQKEMDGIDASRWLYASGKGDWPDDLGYYMGYKISESYYRRAKDKRQAIRDILEIKDFKAFLEASGYAEKPKAGG